VVKASNPEKNKTGGVDSCGFSLSSFSEHLPDGEQDALSGSGDWLKSIQGDICFLSFSRIWGKGIICFVLSESHAAK